jgi:biotin carboxylase
MKKNALIISRASFQTVTKDERIVPTLENYNLFFVYSVRSNHLPPRFLYKELHLVELRNSEDYITSLAELINTKSKLDYIVSVSEQDLLPAAYARENLGLPGLTVEQAEVFRNKVKMKLAIEPVILYPEFIYSQDIDELIKFLDHHKKVILKPILGYGSQNCYVINSSEQLINVCNSLGKEFSEYFIESFCEYPIYHLDALVRNGKIIFSSIGKYNQPPLNFADSNWLISIITNDESALLNNAQDMLKQILECHGINDGVFHLEFFSPTEDVLLFGEIAIRPAGGGITEAIYKAWGIHLFEEHIRIQLGLAPLYTSFINAPIKYSANMLYYSKTSGVIKDIDLSSIQNHPSVRSVAIHTEIGSTVDAARYSADALFTVALVADTYDALEQSIVFINQNSSVVIE